MMNYTEEYTTLDNILGWKFYYNVLLKKMNASYFYCSLGKNK